MWRIFSFFRKNGIYLFLFKLHLSLTWQHYCFTIIKWSLEVKIQKDGFYAKSITIQGNE